MQENRVDVVDVRTNEDSEREVINLYETLGQCSVDKNEIQTIVQTINKESN